MIVRRDFLRLAGGAFGALAFAGSIGGAFAKSGDSNKMKFSTARFDALERESGGRLGVAVLDTQTGERFGHRDGERFPLCSTFKFLLTTAVLQRVDRGEERLDRLIPIAKSDIVSNSPFAETRVGQGATVAQLCEGMMTFSDNTAANLLLPIIGGPEGMTRFARSIGDTVTRLDRNETGLGTAMLDDDRDTTSPRAMVDNLERILLGTVVEAQSRDRVTSWLKDSRTGGTRLRAGLPKSWTVGDKTGSGANGTANDIAIVWPTGRKPVLIAAYLTHSTLEEGKRHAILASVGRELANAFAV